MFTSKHLNWLGLVVVTAGVLMLASACGGNRHSTPAAINTPAYVFAADAIAELDRMTAPAGVDAAVFSKLKEALRAALVARDKGKIACTPPTGTANAIPDLVMTDNGDGTFNYSWHYYNVGDYNQDGTVGIADITPLAMHFSQTHTPAELNTLPAVVDGSADGTVNIADVTPIAMNFGVEVSSYRLEVSTTENGIYTEVQIIPLSAGLDKDIARMRFSEDLTPIAGNWYRLVPLDAGDAAGQASNAVQAPATATVWGHTWGDTLDDEANAVATDSSGHTYIAGSYNIGSYNADSVALVYAGDGSMVWTKTWGGSADDNAYGVAVDGAGNTYVVGETASFGAAHQAFILKYAPYGTLVWQKTWGSGDDSGARAIALDGAGSVYVTGYTYGAGSGYESLLLLKYDTDGNYLDAKALYADNIMGGYAFALDGTGNVYIAGVTKDTPTGYDDMLVVKYSAGGTLQWQKSWGGDNNDDAYGISTDSSGNIFVAGRTWNIGQGGFDVILLKLAADGSSLWQETWGGDGHDEAFAMTKDSGGNLYLAGGTYSYGAGVYDGLLLKCAFDGSVIWQKTWGASDRDDYIRAIALGSDGTFSVAGWDQMPDGVWGSPVGVVASQSVPLLDATGVESITVGADGTPAGTEASPTGVTDTGGGGNDILTLKVDPTGW